MPERPMSMEMPGPERGEAPGAESKEEREAEPIRRTFEYRDTEGRLLGVADVSFSNDTVDMPYKRAKDGADAKGRRVLAFTIRGEKDGKRQAIDLLELANKHGVEVVAADERLVNYEYWDEKKRAVVPPPETPIDVGVFMHELGHADQYHDERFGTLVPLYGQARQATAPGTRLSYTSMREHLDAVVAAVPEAAIALDHEVLGQLSRLEERRQAALDRKAARESDLTEQERLRDDALQSLIDERLAGKIDILDFLLRCGKAEAAAGSAAVPPLVASSETAALIDELENAGFVFSDEDPEEGLGKPVARSSFRDAAAVAAFVHTTFSSMHAPRTALSHDAAAGTLAVDSDVRGVGRVRIVGLPMDAEDFAGYTALRGREDAIVSDLERLVDKAYDEATVSANAQQSLMDHIDLNAIAGLPAKMMERDATRRALQWLREIRQQTGANLLAPHLVPPEALVAVGGRQGAAKEGCVGSTASGMDAGDVQGIEATVREDLNRALATYDADKLRLRPPEGEDGIGITPVAGLDRTKKPENES